MRSVGFQRGRMVEEKEREYKVDVARGVEG